MGHGSHQVSDAYYVKIWALLLFLLVISICGPFLGIQWVTLVTAFGIAIVKALIVANYFMHLNIEKRFISYVLISMLLLVFVFFAGAAVEVMSFKGANWQKTHTEIKIPESSGHH